MPPRRPLPSCLLSSLSLQPSSPNGSPLKGGEPVSEEQRNYYRNLFQFRPGLDCRHSPKHQYVTVSGTSHAVSGFFSAPLAVPAIGPV